MKFEPVTPEELERTFEGRRGRVSYPIIKGFMESNLYAAKVDFEDKSRKPDTMYMLLKSYVSNHDVPIKVLKRKNRILLVRLDINDKGEPVENWRELTNPEATSEEDESSSVPLLGDVEKL